MSKAIVISVKDHDKLSPLMKHMIKREAARMLPVTKEEIRESMRELGEVNK